MAPIVIGGALRLDSASSLSEFVPQQTSLKSFFEMKYALDTGASADNILDQLGQIWLRGVKSLPTKPGNGMRSTCLSFSF